MDTTLAECDADIMESPIPQPASDPLGEVLHTLRMTGTFYCRSELTAPFGAAMPPAPGCMWFHIGLVGECWVSGDDFAPIALQPGTFVLITRGHGHDLYTEGCAERPLVTDLPHVIEDESYALLRHGGGGAPSTLICGIVSLEHDVAEQLVASLPPVIHLDAMTSLQTEWMHSTVRLMAAEATGIHPGGDTIVTRLADILVVQAIRHWLRNDPGAQAGWLGALRDPQIGQALSAIHREPAHAWTVATLAHEAAMSRSAFAARFSLKVGQSPLHYLTGVRMTLARTWLRAPGATIGDVAQRLGYQSEAAFSRAFKRTTGQTPGAVRRA